jgi:hypothetical protein
MEEIKLHNPQTSTYENHTHSTMKGMSTTLSSHPNQPTTDNVKYV